MPRRPRCERPQEFEHPAGAGAKIEQRLDRVRADGFADRRLDSFLRNMQGAHLVPVRRLRREIARRLSRASLADLVEPGTVGGKMRIARCQPCDEIAAKTRHRSRLRDPEENPRPFAMALDKPSFDEEFEMAGYARLRLAENGDEFADGQFGLGDKGEQPQTRGFTRRGGGGENGIESYGIGHERSCKNHLL